MKRDFFILFLNLEIIHRDDSEVWNKISMEKKVNGILTVQPKIKMAKGYCE